jgi:hypothetical protein
MRKRFILSVLILIILFITALNTGFVKENKTGNIAGIVVCEGNPVTDVQVSISGKKVTTDSTGKFFISDIFPGAYIVAVSGDKCIKSYFKPVLGWPDSTTILILSLDTIPRPSLNCKVKVTTQIDSASFVKMDYKHIMELALSPSKKEVVSDSVKKIIINGDTVIEIPGPPYPGPVIEYTEEVIGDITGKQPKIGNIAGVVYSGEPLPGAEVRVRRLSGEWEEVIEYKGVGGKIERIWRKTGQKITYTDSLGRYFFSGIELGKYEMSAWFWSKDGYISSKVTKAQGIKVAPDSTSIVNFGIVPGLLLVEPPLIEHEDAIILCDSTCFFGKIFEEILYVQPITKDPRYKTGNIAGVGPPGVYVGLPYTGLKGVQTDSLGRYFISGIKPGIYQIAASGKDYFSSTGSGIKIVADSTTVLNIILLQDFSQGSAITIPADRPHRIIWQGLMIKCDRNCFFKKSPDEIIKLQREYLDKKYPRECKK